VSDRAPPRARSELGGDLRAPLYEPRAQRKARLGERVCRSSGREIGLRDSSRGRRARAPLRTGPTISSCEIQIDDHPLNRASCWKSFSPKKRRRAVDDIEEDWRRPWSRREKWPQGMVAAKPCVTSIASTQVASLPGTSLRALGGEQHIDS